MSIRPVPGYSQRAISFLVVVLLHALLLFAMLHFMVATPKGAVTAAPEHLLDMIINTARKPVPAPAPALRSRPSPLLPRRGGEHSGAMPSLAPRRCRRRTSPAWAKPCSAVRRRICPT
jgi:hypothetical protein